MADSSCQLAREGWVWLLAGSPCCENLPQHVENLWWSEKLARKIFAKKKKKKKKDFLFCCSLYELG
jgi:hypothetical protein